MPVNNMINKPLSRNSLSCNNRTDTSISIINCMAGELTRVTNSDKYPFTQWDRFAGSQALTLPAGELLNQNQQGRLDGKNERFPVDGDESHDYRDALPEGCDELPEDNKQTKKLSRCVAELKNNIECLLSARDDDEIQVIVDGGHWVRAKGVWLPSHQKVYACYHNNRLVVSDGKIHHIDLEETHYQQSTKTKGVFVPIVCALSQIIQLYPFSTSFAHKTNGSNYQTPSGLDHRLEHREHNVSMPTLTSKLLSSLGSIRQFFNSLYDPFTFPQADAHTVDTALFPQSNRFLYVGAAEWVAMQDTQSVGRDDDTQKNTRENGIEQGEAIQSSVVQEDKFFRNKKNHQNALTSTMVFLVDGLEMSLSLPNAAAKSLLVHLQKDFLQESIAGPYWLDQLLEFDEFIGKRIVKIFHLGLYIKEPNKSLDIIILKKQTEALIDICSKSSMLTEQNKNKTAYYLQDQIKISDYLVHVNDQLTLAHKSIDYKMIIKAIEIRKNKQRSDVSDEIAARRKTINDVQQTYFDKLLHVLNIMHEAHHEYCEQLYQDDDPILDRLLYLNTKSIHQALLNNEIDELSKCLLKMRFYYIFEYTRVNGISVHSFNFIVPGEMTDNWRLFEKNEPELIPEKMDKMFSNELLNFLSLRTEGYPTLTRVFKIIELSRLDKHYQMNNESWQMKNIHPFQQAYKLLAELINTNENEQKKFSHDIAWSEDIKNILYKSKNIFVMLVYIKEFQELFNEEIQIYLKNKPEIKAKTQAQSLVGAKIKAYRSFYRDTSDNDLDHIILLKFEEKVNEGNLNIFLRAAVFWFFSNQQDIDDELLINQSALSIVHNFLVAQKRNFHDYNSRQDKRYIGVYELGSSGEMSLNNYYQQFIDYKKYNSYSEARKFTYQALEIASINYLDLIFPPKEIYTFQVFSRNYIGNSLVPHGYFSSPKHNIGYVSIIKTYTNDFVMLSTLSGFPIMLKITEFEQSDFFKKLIQVWHNEKGNLSLHNRKHHNVSVVMFLSLFSQIKNDFGDRKELIDILVKSPQALINHIPASEYTMVAVKSSDIFSRLKPYSSLMLSEQQIFGQITPLIETMDYLNQATLIAIADQLRETLRELSWLEYVANFIPFFEVGYRHWHDREHKLKFHEVMFDCFDVILAFVSGAISMKRIAGNTFRQVMREAIEQKIAPNMFKRFMVERLIADTPKVGLAGAKVAMTELASIFNPLPFSEKLFTKLVDNVYREIRSSVLITNNAIARNRLMKNKLREQWRIVADNSAVEQNSNGPVPEHSDVKVFYIRDTNDDFQVIRDSHYNRWRVINARLPSYDSAILVTKSQTGAWIAQDFYQSNRDLSPFDFFYGNQAKDGGLESINYEPLVVPKDIESAYDATDAFNKKLLRFYLYRINILNDAGQGRVATDVFLDRVNTKTIFHKIWREIVSSNTYSPEDRILLDGMKKITDEKDGIVRFRAITSWRNKRDRQPITHYALRVDIKYRKYIIELKGLREHLCFSDSQDVFTQDEWLMLYSSHRSNQYELIKYKDFESIEEAKYFPVREATSPSNYINKGVLLKEPLWYKPFLIKKYNAIQKLTYDTNSKIRHDYHVVARTLKQNRKNFAFKEEFPLHILHKCGDLSEDKLVILSSLIQKAKQNSLNSYAILNNKQRINAMSELSLVKNGKLLALYRPTGRLEHLMLSLGDGRFIGLNNRLFSPALPERAGIVISEQMGKFVNGFLTLHHTDNTFLVWVGNAYGARDDTPTMLDEQKFKSIPIYFIDGRIQDYKKVSLSRNEILLGKDSNIGLIYNMPSRLQIRLHGAPFNLNHMDATEFADILRGLAYVEGNEFKFDKLESIDLYTCYGGYGGRFSTAQILADELNLAIKAYPNKISDQLRLRRPEWFTVYRPLTSRPSHDANGHQYIFPGPEFRWPQDIHRRLHYLMNLLRQIRGIISTSRQKRNEDFIADPNIFAPIYAEIFALSYSKNDNIPAKINNLSLPLASQELIKKIIDEYGNIDPEDYRLVEQVYLDVLLSVPEFQYLTYPFTDRPALLAVQSQKGDA